MASQSYAILRITIRNTTKDIRMSDNNKYISMPDNNKINADQLYDDQSGTWILGLINAQLIDNDTLWLQSMHAVKYYRACMFSTL